MEIPAETIVADREGASIDARFKALLDALGDDVDSEGQLHDALVANAAEIRALASACRASGLYQHSAGKVQAAKARLEAEVPESERLTIAWMRLLDRIISAPTQVHQIGSVRLLLPLIADCLPEEAGR